jgi:uncharacterized membrane protein SpoIIM required for sporulation
MVEVPEIQVENSAIKENTVVTKIIKSLDRGDNRSAFLLIFTNNLKGCLLNIFGGVMLGLGTVINLLYNGFFSADMFKSSYDAGLSLSKILNVTLPHSFELIGFWLSGAIGLYIAWNVILFIRGKENFTALFYKTVGISVAVIFFIILGAAYVEAYISTSNYL